VTEILKHLNRPTFKYHKFKHAGGASFFIWNREKRDPSQFVQLGQKETNPWLA